MNSKTLIAQIYAAFNQRNVDEVLSHMTDNVDWPKASEGGRVTGKNEVRAYWSRQWQEFDPHVEPVEVLDDEHGRTHVRVHQLVKSLSGDVLSDSEVWHIYTMAHGLVERMDLALDKAGSQQAPSGILPSLESFMVACVAMPLYRETAIVNFVLPSVEPLESLPLTSEREFGFFSPSTSRAFRQAISARPSTTSNGGSSGAAAFGVRGMARQRHPAGQQRQPDLR